MEGIYTEIPTGLQNREPRARPPSRTPVSPQTCWPLLGLSYPGDLCGPSLEAGWGSASPAFLGTGLQMLTQGELESAGRHRPERNTHTHILHPPYHTGLCTILLPYLPLQTRPDEPVLGSNYNDDSEMG